MKNILTVFVCVLFFSLSYADTGARCDELFMKNSLFSFASPPSATTLFLRQHVLRSHVASERPFRLRRGSSDSRVEVSPESSGSSRRAPRQFRPPNITEVRAALASFLGPMADSFSVKFDFNVWKAMNPTKEFELVDHTDMPSYSPHQARNESLPKPPAGLVLETILTEVFEPQAIRTFNIFLSLASVPVSYRSVLFEPNAKFEMDRKDLLVLAEMIALLRLLRPTGEHTNSKLTKHQFSKNFWDENGPTAAFTELVFKTAAQMTISDLVDAKGPAVFATPAISAQVDATTLLIAFVSGFRKYVASFRESQDQRDFDAAVWNLLHERKSPGAILLIFKPTRRYSVESQLTPEPLAKIWNVFQ